MYPEYYPEFVCTNSCSLSNFILFTRVYVSKGNILAYIIVMKNVERCTTTGNRASIIKTVVESIIYSEYIALLSILSISVKVWENFLTLFIVQNVN